MMHVFWKFFYKLRNKNANISKSALIYGPIEMDNNGEIMVGENTRIRRWCCIKPYGGKIVIGNNCSINSFCHFSGNGNITIGNNVLIATQCVMISANHNFKRCDIPIAEQGETRAPIVIEDNCWIGAGSKILMGVTIGHDSVVGAGSVVTKNVPPFSVVVGVPGRVLYDRRQNIIED